MSSTAKQDNQPSSPPVKQEMEVTDGDELPEEELDEILESVPRRVAEWLGVLVDFLNLGEQLFVYFLVESGLTPEALEVIFRIFLAVGFGSAAGKTFRSPRLKILYTILVESAELAVYLTLESIIGETFDPELKRTFTIGVSSFYGAQVLLLLVQFPMVARTRERLGPGRFVGKLFLNLLQYTSVNTFTIIFVYLASDSRFKRTWFEVLVTVVIFMSNSLNDLIFNSGAFSSYFSSIKKKITDQENAGDAEDNGNDWKLLFKKMREKSLLPGWYLAMIYLVSVGLTLVYMVASIVYSIQHLEEHDKFGVPLLDYDKGVYIYFVVVLGLICCPFACLCLCLPFICCGALKSSD